MLVGLMYPNGLVWRRIDANKKEDQMMLGLMYAVEAEKRARQERERQIEAKQVPVPARKPARPRAEAQRRPRGVGRLVAAMGGIGW